METHVREVFVHEDPRFTVIGALLRLNCRAGRDGDTVEVPVETLPVGELGLPLQLNMMKIGAGK